MISILRIALANRVAPQVEVSKRFHRLQHDQDLIVEITNVVILEFQCLDSVKEV